MQTADLSYGHEDISNVATPLREREQQLPRSMGLRRRYFSVWWPERDGLLQDFLSNL